jgi:hypothetical protein
MLGHFDVMELVLGNYQAFPRALEINSRDTGGSSISVNLAPFSLTAIPD